jgi:hypothetical protein
VTPSTSSPTSSSTTTLPPVGGFPDASNTGVPAGVTLTAYTGPTNITTAGTVIDGKQVDACLVVNAARVIIRNSRLNCSGGYVVLVEVSRPSTDWLQIVDSEVDCGNSNATGIGYDSIVVTRVEIRGCENGLDIDRNMIVEDSWIHLAYNGGGAHADGIQTCCAVNVTVRHNTIINQDAAGANGDAAIITPASAGAMLVDGNFLAGGSYTLYCPEIDGSQFRVRNNTFAHIPGPLGAAYGYAVDCENVAEFSGNVTDTGEPVNR